MISCARVSPSTLTKNGYPPEPMCISRRQPGYQQIQSVANYSNTRYPRCVQQLGQHPGVCLQRLHPSGRCRNACCRVTDFKSLPSAGFVSECRILLAGFFNALWVLPAGFLSTLLTLLPGFFATVFGQAAGLFAAAFPAGRPLLARCPLDLSPCGAPTSGRSGSVEP